MMERGIRERSNGDEVPKTSGGGFENRGGGRGGERTGFIDKARGWQRGKGSSGRVDQWTSGSWIMGWGARLTVSPEG